MKNFRQEGFPSYGLTQTGQEKPVFKVLVSVVENVLTDALLFARVSNTYGVVVLGCGTVIKGTSGPQR